MRRKASVFLALTLALYFSLEACLQVFKVLFPTYVNLTSSMPRGIYTLEKETKIEKESLVVARLPKGAEGFHYPWLMKTWPLLKKVVGLEG